MKKNDILMILIPTFIFAFAWIGFSLLHNVATSTISEALDTQIAPIAPDFDTNTITELKKRTNVTPAYQITVPIQNIVIPIASSAAAPTPTPTIIQPVSTNSAEQTVSGGSLAQ